jgi:hypothetical protein
MSLADSNIPDDRDLAGLQASVEDEPWYADSQIEPSENLSDLPSEVPELVALDDPEDTETQGEEDEAFLDSEDADKEEEPESVVIEPGNLVDEDKDTKLRSKTIARKQMLRERRRMIAQGTLPEVLDYERPAHRSECREAARPCLYVSCRYHLYLDVNPVTGSIKINFPGKEAWELQDTCALDVAERGGITLEEVGDIMNLTRERIRQVEMTGLTKLKDDNAHLETFLDGRDEPVTARGPMGHGRLPVLDRLDYKPDPI